MSTLQHSEVVQHQAGVAGTRSGRIIRVWTMPEHLRLIRAALAGQLPHEMVLLFPGRTQAAVRSYYTRLTRKGELPRVGRNYHPWTKEIAADFAAAVQAGATTTGLMKRFERSAAAIESWKKRAGLVKPPATRWSGDEIALLVAAWVEATPRHIYLATLSGRSESAVGKKLHLLKKKGLLPALPHRRPVETGVSGQAG